jgi:hypothetical protein
LAFSYLFFFPMGEGRERGREGGREGGREDGGSSFSISSS